LKICDGLPIFSVYSRPEVLRGVYWNGTPYLSAYEKADNGNEMKWEHCWVEMNHFRNEYFINIIIADISGLHFSSFYYLFCLLACVLFNSISLLFEFSHKTYSSLISTKFGSRENILRIGYYIILKIYLFYLASFFKWRMIGNIITMASRFIINSLSII